MLSHADGDSTLITSAPIDARCSVANGPAHIIDRSTTRTPASGSCPRSPVARRTRRPLDLVVGDVGRLPAEAAERPAGDRRLADRAPARRAPAAHRGRSARQVWLAMPIGTLLARPRASSSSFGLSMNHTYIFTVTCSSFSGTSRWSGSAKRGSASSGSPTRREQVGICRSRQNTPAQPSSAGYTPHCPRVWLPRRMNTGMPTAVSGPYSSSIPAAHSWAEMSTSSPA